MKEGDKLYVVSRSDLPTGVQMAQQGHAVSEFWARHFDLAKEWHDKSNFICVLHIDDEHLLTKLMHKAIDKHIPCAGFREPDIEDQLTAIVLHPTGKDLVRHLRLAFSSN